MNIHSFDTGYLKNVSEIKEKKFQQGYLFCE